MKYDRKDLSNDELIRLYKLILKPRVIEERMLKLLRQGRVSKWFSGIGQEGIAVGVTAALHSDEYVCPLHRNLGVFTTRNCDLQQLFEQFQGKAGGFSQGRERSFHFGTNEHHIVGMISHLGPQLCVADGIALANKLRQEKKITVAFTGDGGTSEGDFHEACNIAAVWDLPVILLIENNGYGDNSAIANLVAALNAAQPDEADHYRWIASPDGQPIGTDAITVGLIYRPASVTPQGAASLIVLPVQQAEALDASGKPVAINQGMRESLLQQFSSPKGGAPLTLVVNHLKSKGSGCLENLDGKEPADLQGKCTEFRVSAAKVLGEFRAEIAKLEK